jgi:membrane protease YdiL (CAAX protease family)
MSLDLQFLAFFALLMTFISLWVHKSPWLWLSFLVIAYILALQSGVAKPFSLVPVGTLLLIHIMLRRNLPESSRWILLIGAALISVALLFHWIPGFSNYWDKTGQFWINFDTPFTGLFILALQLPLIRSCNEGFNLSYKVIPLTGLAVALLLFLGNYFGSLKWEFNWPLHCSLRLITTLFFVIIPQEAFFRGFIQRECFNWIGHSAKGHIGAVLFSSIIFTLCNMYWISGLQPLAFIFLAGLIYGSLYQYTQAIESSIFCNFTLTFLHLVLGLSI